MNMNEAIESFLEYITCEELVPTGYTLPTHKIVCPQCEGEGTHGPGWVFTEEDRYEMGPDFDDTMEEMKRGAYDVPCEQCKGLRVIDELDEDKLNDELKPKWHNWLDEIRDMEAMERQERMMGA